MDEKMRAEFEAAAKADQGLDVTRLPHGGYRSFATHQAWWAWQASRAALVVKLPQGSEPGDFAHPVMVAEVEAVISAIEAAGVRVKE